MYRSAEKIMHGAVKFIGALIVKITEARYRCSIIKYFVFFEKFKLASHKAVA